MATQNKIHNYCEADLILLHNLNRLVGQQHNPLMQQWLSATTSLTDKEQYLFDIILDDAQQNIYGWHEEELKMKFIAFVLRLG